MIFHVAFRQLGANQGSAGKNLEKLSSGLRINRAGDDAAGLAISEKMRGQIRGLEQAQRNSQDAISLIQTAEGALNETHSILQRMKELATQASNDTYADSDRAEIQKEINQLTSEINRIGNTTEFNTKKVLNGDISAQSGIVTATTVTNGGATTLSNLSLDKKSSLDAGNYSVQVQDTVTKSVSHTAGAEVTGMTIAENSALGTGNYQVTITETEAKTASLGTAADSVTGVSVNPLSSQPDGAHTVAITRVDSVATGAFTGATTGLTADGISVLGTAGVSGTYTVTTTATLSGLSGTGGANGVAGTASDGSASAISLQLDDPTALGNATDYRLAYTEVTAGIFSVELQNSAGTALTEAVILDNNVQNYNFKVAGSPAVDFGVSFTTAASVNTALAGQNGLHHSFDVSTTVTLKDGSGTPVATDTIAAGDTLGGSLTIGDFTIAHGAGSTINHGQTDSFAITNTLSATFNGGDTQTFAAGQTVNFSNGVSVTTDGDISLYDAAAPESYTINIGTVDTYTATVENAGGGTTTPPSQTVTVADGGTFNLGNGVEINVGTLTGSATHPLCQNSCRTPQ
jgi:flagellin